MLLVHYLAVDTSFGFVDHCRLRCSDIFVRFVYRVDDRRGLLTTRCGKKRYEKERTSTKNLSGQLKPPSTGCAVHSPFARTSSYCRRRRARARVARRAWPGAILPKILNSGFAVLGPISRCRGTTLSSSISRAH